MKNNLHFKKGKISIIGIFVLGAFILMALFLILNGIWFGLFFLFPAIVIFSVREGVYVDVEKRMYKSYLSVLGITPARWKPIPEGTKIGIRIVKFVANRRVGLVQMDSTAAGTTFELYLYFPQPAKVVLQLQDNVEKLYFEAQNLSHLLGHDVIVDQRIPEKMYNKQL